MKKTSLVAGALVAAVTVGSFGVAQASVSKSSKSVSVVKPSIGGANALGVNPLKPILDGLVTKLTISQAQEDAILAAVAAAKPAIGNGVNGGMGVENDGPRGGMGMMNPANQAAEKALILSTLGITDATLQAAQTAGTSLATLAGVKTQALIDALVALENKQIDASVTSGQLTAAQATTQKAGTVARVTAHVNATPAKPGLGAMGKGRMGGHGRGPAGAPGAPGAPVAPPTNG